MTIQNVDPSLIAMFTQQEGTVGVRGSTTQFVLPTRNVAPTDQQYTFEIPHLTGDYVDLKNVELYIRGNLTRANGTLLEKNEKVVLVNNTLHSLFESAVVMIGHNQCEIQTNMYPYKAFLRQLMTIKTNCPDNVDQGLTRLRTITEPLVWGEVQLGLERVPWTAESKRVEFCGRTCIDCFQTPGYLLPGTPVTVTFKRSREAFYVTRVLEHKEVEYRFNIEKIGLFVPSIKISPHLEPLLEMQTENSPARYPCESITTRRYTFPPGIVTNTYRQVFHGKIPSKLAVTFYQEDVFTGNPIRAALRSSIVGLRRIQVAVNGMVVREHAMDIPSEYLPVFRQWTEWLGVSKENWMFSKDDYLKHMGFIPFDFMENCKGSKCDEEALLTGSLDIYVEFTEPISIELVMMVYELSPDTLQINKDRTARYVRTIV